METRSEWAEAFMGGEEMRDRGGNSFTILAVKEKTDGVGVESNIESRQVSLKMEGTQSTQLSMEEGEGN